MRQSSISRIAMDMLTAQRPGESRGLWLSAILVERDAALATVVCVALRA